MYWQAISRGIMFTFRPSTLDLTTEMNGFQKHSTCYHAYVSVHYDHNTASKITGSVPSGFWIAYRSQCFASESLSPQTALRDFQKMYDRNAMWCAAVSSGSRAVLREVVSRGRHECFSLGNAKVGCCEQMVVAPANVAPGLAACACADRPASSSEIFHRRTGPSHGPWSNAIIRSRGIKRTSRRSPEKATRKRRITRPAASLCCPARAIVLNLMHLNLS
ncbi:hypothetical protein HBH92_087530 [Parastagonospora nodorum]|nr:hypothetical protein HBH92_087530 [Parastagonospora nodorum]KAH4437327.1 hypothetical protein HBH93_103070 [Parastagonospora nodorum]KAH4450670.1 hypothetical protein HBH91_122450 [Parastagonospora nodorum]KAH4544607.1 hypothetical protein HBH85_097180 [Parastagonospora nodorum]KAH4873278.1 hypothetical protein HBH59_107340 [Parastagonospora nodorum]